MKILLHTCCAPCLIYPAHRLRKAGFQVTAFFYNPNIYPSDEYHNRRQALVSYNATKGIQIIFPEYLPSEFSSAVNDNAEKPQRCSSCWALRLERSAQFAKENGFNAFSTTLLVSPYQDQEEIKKIGNEISAKVGIQFYFEDFRPGFKKAHDEAKAKGIYCQKYCGCFYSMKPRLTQRCERKSAG